LEKYMDSVLRPRDIQARIRAGEAPETVAAAAQTSVDKIMGFATPVLAERAYQAQLAQRASVRRRVATGHVGNLGAAVTTHLESLDVDPEAVEWDAWRREDGRWTVVAAYPAGGEDRRAAFTYDAAGRFVVADDDEARTLVGERSVPGPDTSVPPATPVLREVHDADPVEPVPHAIDELLAAREPREVVQLPLGDDAIGLVTGGRPLAGHPADDRDDDRPDDRPDDPADEGRRDEPALPAARADVHTHPSARGIRPAPGLTEQPPGRDLDLDRELTVDLSDTSATVRSAPRAGTGDADWISTQASDRPAPAPAPRPDGAPQSQPWDQPGDGETVEGGAREEEQEEAEALFEVPPAEHAPATEPVERPARVSRARGRASVPSWDEIMFGTPKSE
jgi:hypothetical protein